MDGSQLAWHVVVVPAKPVGALKKELDDWKRKIDSSAVESALSSLQIVISHPAALFDTYAVIAALDEVVNVRKDKKDDRATRFEILLRQCRPLINNPALQQMLIKLVAPKEVAEVAKVIAKLNKRVRPREPRAVRGTDVESSILQTQ